MERAKYALFLCCFYLVIIFVYGQPSYSKQKSDSLIRVWKNEKLPDTSRLKAIYYISWYGYLYSLPDSAVYFAQKHLELAKKTGLKKQQADALNTIGTAYIAIGNYKKAIEHLTSCLQIKESLNDSVGIANALSNIGSIYYYENDTAMSMHYNKKALAYLLPRKPGKSLASVYSNIGQLYAAKNEFQYAIGLERKALFIRESLKDNRSMAGSFSIIGNYLQQLGKLDSALYFLQKSLAISEKLNNVKQMSSTLASLADLYEELDQYPKAIAATEKLFNLALGSGMDIYVQLGSEKLSRYYKATGKYDKALQMYEKYISVRDSISNEEAKKSLIKNQLKYEYEKKAAADSVKAGEEKKVVQAQLKQEKTQRYSLIVGLLLVAIFAVFMVNRFRVTNKQKKLIEEQKKVVETQKHLVEEKQKEILDSIYYARRIQQALITNEQYIHKNLKRLKG